MSHPYEKYENTELWKTLENAVNTLVDNNDLELTTNIKYVIGYLCKCLLSAEDGSENPMR
jgi:hypothetical protein